MAMFKSTIKIDETGAWYIELIDTADGRIMFCNTIDEYEKNVELLGEDYGGHVDEIQWLKDDNVEQYILDEIRLEMDTYQEKLEQNKEDGPVN